MCNQAAWRRVIGGGRKEKAMRLRKPENAQPTDDAEAVWPDGVVWKVPYINVHDLDTKSSKAAGGKSTAYLELEHPQGRLSLKKIKNGEKLIAAIWQTFQEKGKKKDVQVAQMILSGLTDTQQAKRDTKTNRTTFAYHEKREHVRTMLPCKTQSIATVN